MLSRVSRGDFLLRDELASFADRCLQRDDGLGSVVTTYAQTRYVSFIRFIEWLAEPVLLRMKSMERRSLKADLLSFTRRAEAQKPSGHSGIDPVERLGLLPSQRALLLEVIDPKSPKNPFQKKLRVRNHAMILFCYTYGVRAGELLGLRRSDYKDGRLPKTMSIHRRPHDEHDRRPVPVRAKTRARMLEIDGPAGLALDAWVTERMDRSKFPNARKNAFLFVNSRGDEISLRGARLVFERLRDFYPELGCFSQHVLRHDVNERLVEETAAHGWEPAEVRQDAIYLMGWSENSKMPDVYARRAISQRANERIAKLQEKDHST